MFLVVEVQESWTPEFTGSDGIRRDSTSYLDIKDTGVSTGETNLPRGTSETERCRVEIPVEGHLPSGQVDVSHSTGRERVWCSTRHQYVIPLKFLSTTGVDNLPFVTFPSLIKMK